MATSPALISRLEASRAADGVEAFAVYRCESTLLRLVAWVGNDPPRETAPYSLPPLGTVALKGKAILIEKSHSRPDKYQSIAVLPIGEGEVVGVLSCASPRKGFFRNEEKAERAKALAAELAENWSDWVGQISS